MCIFTSLPCHLDIISHCRGCKSAYLYLRYRGLSNTGYISIASLFAHGTIVKISLNKLIKRPFQNSTAGCPPAAGGYGRLSFVQPRSNKRQPFVCVLISRCLPYIEHCRTRAFGWFKDGFL